MIERSCWLQRVRDLLDRFPVVALVGARQVGKSTLAGQICRSWSGGASRFDLEDPRDVSRLASPMTALEPLRGLVVLDEAQRVPELFPVLRVLADRPGRPATFLVLGSSSPALARQSGESLAGRIASVQLSGFGVDEVGASRWSELWLRGGFPRAFLAATGRDSLRWRREYINALLGQDLARLGYSLNPESMRRFLSMVAHYHGQIWNASEVGRSFGASHKTAERDLDLLCGAFLARRLRPWHENLGKRLVKSPKVYLTDAGILHAVFDLASRNDLLGHPKCGASFEGFAMEQVLLRLGAEAGECYFWATHQGAELDLLVVRGNRRVGVEVKLTDSPSVTRSMRQALQDLRPERIYVIHSGSGSYPLDRSIDAVSVSRIQQDIPPLDEEVEPVHR